VSVLSTTAPRLIPQKLITPPARLPIQCIGDFNLDGKPDLAVANFSAHVSVFINNGTGALPHKSDYATGSTPVSVAVGDFKPGWPT